MRENYFAIDLKGYKNALFASVASLHDPDADFKAAEFDADTFSGRKKELKRLKPDIVYVRGHTLDFNRKALEAPETTILSRPYPIDNTLAKIAARQEKAFEICAADIIRSRGYPRARMIQSISRTVMLARKYSIPLAITSGAKDIYSLVTPRELVSFGMLVGLDCPSAKACISNVASRILERGRST